MSAKTPTPIKLQRALYELMWRQSYGRVTIDAICAEAGVKKGSFYHAYPDKASLAVDAFDYFWTQETKPWLDSVFSMSLAPLERIAAWLESGYQKTVTCQKEHGAIYGCPLFNVGSEISTLELEVASQVRIVLDHQRRYLATTLREAVAADLVDLDDPEEVARDVLTLVEGALTQARISNNAAPLRRLPNSVGRLIGARLPDPQNLTVS